MPISGANSFGSLTWIRNACARGFGIAAYSSLGTLDANAVDDALAHAMDRVALEGQHQWLRNEDGIATTAGYSTGTAAVTISSAAVTGTGTAWNTSSNVIARDVFNVGEGGFYRVASVASDTSLTLESAYSEATNATASYTTYRDQYALPSDFLRLISVREIDATRTIEVVSRAQWAQLWAGDYQTGRPTHCFLSDAVDSLTGTGQYLQLYPIPDAVYGYQVLYDQFPTWQATGGNPIPGSPVAMQATLHCALAALFLHDAERGPMYEVHAQSALERLRKHQDRTRRQRMIASPQFGRPLGPVWPANYGNTITTDNG